MKTWKTAEVVELSIKETASGLFPAGYEGVFGDCICDNEEDHFMISDDHVFNKDKNDTPNTLS